MLKRVLRVVGVTIALLAVIFYVVFGGMMFGNVPSMPDAEIVPGVIQIVDGYVNAFLIEGGPEQVALIDAGNDPEGRAILAALKARGHAPSAVRAILLTHGHPDHTAAAHLFPDAQVYAFAEDIPIASGEKRAGGPLPKLIDMPKEKTTRVDRTLEDGANVVVGTATITAYHVPGHTGGSAVFRYRDALFFGDNATGRDDGTVTSAPWVVSDDVELNVASLVALRRRLATAGISVRTLAFGHSGPKQGDGVMSALPQ